MKPFLNSLSRSGFWLKKASIGTLLVSAITLSYGINNTWAQDKHLVFYEVSHGWLGHPFWAVVDRGMKDAAKTYGVDLVILHGNAPANSAQQSEKIERALAASPDGLIVSLPDAKGVESSLARATAKGIPIIAMNVADTRPPAQRIPYITYVGSDEYLSGAKAAEELVKDPKVTVGLCVNTNAGQSALVAKCKGFTDVFQKAGKKASTIVVSPDSPTQAAEQFRAYYMANSDANGLFVVDAVYTLNIVKVLKEMGDLSKISIYTNDLLPEVLDDIQSGQITGTIDQQPYAQGYLAVELLYFYKTYGIKLASDVLTGPAIVDKTNAAITKDMVAKGYR
ncbi:sugar ABC transporter substrate-binding protein [Pantoea cypripedii]|uniref:Periplasmic binding protein domain-containing protein n=1 Tax=Pantoea cypripedii TaxID=55209 RepID=A0A6B9G752_PANCY|nr:sugar ABC transporter substrate-binding protein [Pantoea cypripedii]QGY32948.1 hypothetical protein CUN67_28875 [Pantoea cypripedii]